MAAALRAKLAAQKGLPATSTPPAPPAAAAPAASGKKQVGFGANQVTVIAKTAKAKQPEPEPEPEPEADAEPDVEADAEPEPEAEADADAEAPADGDAEAPADAEAEAPADADAEAEAAPEADAEAEPEAAAEPDPEPEPEPKPLPPPAPVKKAPVKAVAAATPTKAPVKAAAAAPAKAPTPAPAPAPVPAPRASVKIAAAPIPSPAAAPAAAKKFALPTKAATPAPAAAPAPAATKAAPAAAATRPAAVKAAPAASPAPAAAAPKFKAPTRAATTQAIVSPAAPAEAEADAEADAAPAPAPAPTPAPVASAAPKSVATVSKAPAAKAADAKTAAVVTKAAAPAKAAAVAPSKAAAPAKSTAAAPAAAAKATPSVATVAKAPAAKGAPVPAAAPPAKVAAAAKAGDAKDVKQPAAAANQKTPVRSGLKGAKEKEAAAAAAAAEAEAAKAAAEAAEKAKAETFALEDPALDDGNWAYRRVPHSGVPYYQERDSGQIVVVKPSDAEAKAKRSAAGGGAGDGKDVAILEGEYVWVEVASRDAEEKFIKAKKVSTSKTGKHLCKTEDGKNIEAPGSVFPSISPYSGDAVDPDVHDLVMCGDMTPANVLHVLRERFTKQHHIYTAIGDILISLNPYPPKDPDHPLHKDLKHRLAKLYDTKAVHAYRDVDPANPARALPPHIFTIARTALHGCCYSETNRNQSVIISGESGAGKTEATKQVLHFLAEVAGGADRSLEEKIVRHVTPILEGFGNAKTLRNDNSSRFGKYCQVYFDEKTNVVVGASNQNYLLEKSRVCQVAQNERNFHVFYELVVGLKDPALRAQLFLEDDVGAYAYLNQSVCRELEGVDDAEEFAAVETAFKAMEFPAATVAEIWKIVSAVLTLGNVKFTPKDASDKNSDAALTGQDEILSRVAALLDVKVEELGHRMLHKKIVTTMNRKEHIIEKKCKLEDAQNARDALAKFVYSKLFDYLVVRINEALLGKAGKATGRVIGILDIFGFEIMTTNSLEQLCINYTNEKLQQQFNEHTFNTEQAEYRREAIDWKDVATPSSQGLLDLIERDMTKGIGAAKAYGGVFAVLDEQLKFNGSDDKFVTLLVDIHKDHKESAKYFVYDSKNRAMKDIFTIVHYAAPVRYTARGFNDKNNDQLETGLVELLRSSSNKLLQRFFADDMDEKARKLSLTARFKGQVTALMATLNATVPNYVRCVKPNEKKAPMELRPRLTFDQLKYSGVFEAVTIRKRGFPYRRSHAEFVRRYRCTSLITGATLSVVGDAASSADDGGGGAAVTARDVCAELLESMAVPCALGKTRVLYRVEEHRVLEVYRALACDRLATRLQAWTRMIFRHRQWQQLRRAKHAFAQCDRKLNVAAEEDGAIAKQLAALDAALKQSQAVSFARARPELRDRLQQLTDAALKTRATLVAADSVQTTLKAFLAMPATATEQEIGAVYGGIRKALLDAKRLAMAGTIYATQAAQRIAPHADRMECIDGLTRGLAEANEPLLARSLEAAAKLGVHVPDQIAKAEQMLAAIRREKEDVLAALNAGLATGGWMKDGDVISWDLLTAGLARAAKCDVKTRDALFKVALSQHLLVLRRAMQAAVPAPITDVAVWQAVTAAIAAIDAADADAEAKYNDEKLHAEQYGLSQDEAQGGIGAFKRLSDALEVKVARNEMALRRRIAECKAGLAQGTAELDQAKLETALAEAADLKMDAGRFAEVKEAQDVLAFLVAARRDAALVLKQLSDARAADGLDERHSAELDAVVAKGQASALMHIDEFKAALDIATRIADEKQWLAALAEQVEAGRWLGPAAGAAAAAPEEPVADAADDDEPAPAPAPVKAPPKKGAPAPAKTAAATKAGGAGKAAAATKAGSAGKAAAAAAKPAAKPKAKAAAAGAVHAGDYEHYPKPETLNVEALAEAVAAGVEFGPDLFVGRTALALGQRLVAVRERLRDGAVGTQNAEAWKAVEDEYNAFVADKALAVVRGAGAGGPHVAARTAALGALFVECGEALREWTAVADELDYQHTVQQVTARLVAAQEEQSEPLLEQALAEADAARMLDAHNPDVVASRLLLARLRAIRALVHDSSEALAAFADAVAGRGYVLQHKEDLQALRERATKLGGVDDLEEVAAVTARLKLVNDEELLVDDLLAAMKDGGWVVGKHKALSGAHGHGATGGSAGRPARQNSVSAAAVAATAPVAPEASAVATAARRQSEVKRAPTRGATMNGANGAAAGMGLGFGAAAAGQMYFTDYTTYKIDGVIVTEALATAIGNAHDIGSELGREVLTVARAVADLRRLLTQALTLVVNKRRVDVALWRSIRDFIGGADRLLNGVIARRECGRSRAEFDDARRETEHAIRVDAVLVELAKRAHARDRVGLDKYLKEAEGYGMAPEFHAAVSEAKRLLAGIRDVNATIAVQMRVPRPTSADLRALLEKCHALGFVTAEIKALERMAKAVAVLEHGLAAFSQDDLEKGLHMALESGMCMNDLIFDARHTLQNMNTLRETAPAAVAAARHAINFQDGCTVDQYEALGAVCKTADSLGGMADDDDVKTALKLRADIDAELKLIAELKLCFAPTAAGAGGDASGLSNGGWTNTGVKADAMAEGNENLPVTEYYQGVVAGDTAYYQSAADIHLEPLVGLTTRAKTVGMKTRAGKTTLRMAIFVVALRKAVLLALQTKKWRPVERLCHDTANGHGDHTASGMLAAEQKQLMSLPEYLAARNEAAYQRRCARAVDALNQALSTDDRKGLEQLLRGSDAKGKQQSRGASGMGGTISSMPVAGKTVMTDANSLRAATAMGGDGLATPTNALGGGLGGLGLGGSGGAAGLHATIHAESVARLNAKNMSNAGAVALLNLDSDHCGGSDSKVAQLVAKAHSRLKALTNLDAFFNAALTAPDNRQVFDQALALAEKHQYQPPDVIAKLKSLKERVNALYEQCVAAADTFDVNELRKVVAQIVPLGLEQQNICNVCRATLKHLTNADVYHAGSDANRAYGAFLHALLNDEMHKQPLDDIRIAALKAELSRLSRESRKQNLRDSAAAASSAAANGTGTGATNGSVSHNWQFHPSLRHPLAWAAQKKFWVFDKQALADAMLLYSDAPLHAALSDPYDDKQHEALKPYDSIRGELDPAKLPLRELTIAEADAAREQLALKWNAQLLAYLSSTNRDLAIPLVKTGIECRELRNEIYFQLLKQLTFCANATARERGWRLLGLVLKHVRPDGDRMVRSLEQFLLKYDADAYLEDLHKLVFMDEKQLNGTASPSSAAAATAAGNTGHMTTTVNGALDTMAMSSIIEPPVPEWERAFMRTSDDKIAKLRICG